MLPDAARSLDERLVDLDACSLAVGRGALAARARLHRDSPPSSSSAAAMPAAPHRRPSALPRPRRPGRPACATAALDERDLHPERREHAGVLAADHAAADHAHGCAGSGRLSRAARRCRRRRVLERRTPGGCAGASRWRSRSSSPRGSGRDADPGVGSRPSLDDSTSWRARFRRIRRLWVRTSGRRHIRSLTECSPVEGPPDTFVALRRLKPVKYSAVSRSVFDGRCPYGPCAAGPLGGALDEGDLLAEVRGRGSGLFACRPAAEYHEVVSSFRDVSSFSQPWAMASPTMSPIAIVVTWGFTPRLVGNTLASATRRFAHPHTRPARSPPTAPRPRPSGTCPWGATRTAPCGGPACRTGGRRNLIGPRNRPRVDVARHHLERAHREEHLGAQAHPLEEPLPVAVAEVVVEVRPGRCVADEALAVDVVYQRPRARQVRAAVHAAPAPGAVLRAVVEGPQCSSRAGMPSAAARCPAPRMWPRSRAAARARRPRRRCRPRARARRSPNNVDLCPACHAVQPLQQGRSSGSPLCAIMSARRPSRTSSARARSSSLTGSEASIRPAPRARRAAPPGSPAPRRSAGSSWISALLMKRCTSRRDPGPSSREPIRMTTRAST